MKQLITIIILSSFIFISCDFLDDGITLPINTQCDEQATVDGTKYNQTTTTNYAITNVVLNGDCLEVTVSGSGCDPNNWDMNFISVASLTNIFPPLYQAKIELINNEACLAVFQKTVSFDLTSMQLTGQNQIQIKLEGWNTNIFYQY